MRKIRETLTALVGIDNPSIIRINKKDNEILPNEHLEMILKYFIKTVLIIAVTVLIINLEPLKLIVLAVFGFVFSMIYFGFKD